MGRKGKKAAAALEPLPLGQSLVAAAQAGLSALADATSIRSNCFVATGFEEGVCRCTCRNLWHYPVTQTVVWGDKAGSKREGRSALPRTLSFGGGRRWAGWKVWRNEEVCSLPPQIVLLCVWGFLFCRVILTVSSPLWWWEGETGKERMKRVCGAILAASRKVCWNRVFFRFAAVFTLVMLSQRFVSVRNILRLWYTVIWNSFPLAVLQCLLGPCYQYQHKKVLPFS